MVLACLGLVAVVIVGLGTLGASLDEEFEASSEMREAGAREVPASLADATSDPGAASRSNWKYHERTDELRGSTDHFARIDSENEVHFEWPYSGGSRLVITVRETAAYGSDVIFHITDGQFTCGVYDCAGMISFDGAPERLTLSTPADHDSQTLFATYDQAILRKLRNADSVVVELPFYQEGNRQFTFETAGLEWPH